LPGLPPGLGAELLGRGYQIRIVLSVLFLLAGIAAEAGDYFYFRFRRFFFRVDSCVVRAQIFHFPYLLLAGIAARPGLAPVSTI